MSRSISAGNFEIIPLFIPITWKKNNHTIVVDVIISNCTSQDADHFSFCKVPLAAERRRAPLPYSSFCLCTVASGLSRAELRKNFRKIFQTWKGTRLSGHLCCTPYKTSQFYVWYSHSLLHWDFVFLLFRPEHTSQFWDIQLSKGVHPWKW